MKTAVEWATVYTFLRYYCKAFQCWNSAALCNL